MFRNASFLITLAGHPFAAAFLAGMNRKMDSASPGSEQRELTALLRALADGEQGALQPLYARTSAKLYGICLRLLGNPEDAQDVLQTVFVTAWQKAHAFDPARASPITWLAAMTRNRAIDRLRQRGGKLEDLEAAADVADGRPSAIEVIEEAEDHNRLRRCLEELDERPRTMISAAFLDGASYPELARREGVPLSTMKSWVRRGLMKLRGCMER